MSLLTELEPIRSRLEQGVAQAALRAVPEEWAGTAGAVDLDGPVLRAVLTQLYTGRQGSPRVDQVDGCLDQLAAELAGSRPALLTVLFRSADLLMRIPELGGQRALDLADCWLGLCWTAEAAGRAINGALTDTAFADGDRELLVPLAARLRFLALSEPMRHRCEKGTGWPPEAAGYGANGLCGHAFGTSSWNVLVGRCREARTTWIGFLDAHQAHPYLSAAQPTEFEQELDAVIFRAPSKGLLGLSNRPLDEPARLTAEDDALLSLVVERHLLPRFKLLRVARVALYADRRSGIVARVLVGALALTALTVTIGLTVWRNYPWATVASGACYLLIGLGVVFFGQRWATPWLLRIPAASTVGVIALIGFLPEGWLTGAPDRVTLAVMALVTAAFGYLVIEARNHGVERWRAVGRSAGIALAGAGHALLVALIGLVAVGPAFVPGLADLWSRPAGHGSAAIMLLATSWCLAAGVFSQILWDDRPITAPLAHQTWR